VNNAQSATASSWTAAPASQSHSALPANGSDNAAQAAARIALAKALFGTAPQNAAATPGSTASMATTQSSAPYASSAAATTSTSVNAGNYVGKDLGLKPIAAPALPISSDKQFQLDALLQKYKADLITPEEYHKQRAAILAQP
jgi:hypothetical protein